MHASYHLLTDMEQTEIPQSPVNKPEEDFKWLLTILELAGIIIILLTIIWIMQFRGGFSWTSDPSLEFNWHPLLMIVGFVFLYANAMLIYRIQRSVRKRRLKLFHTGLMLFAVIFVVVALIAVFDSHNLKTPPSPNMYSLHSWMGLISVVLFCFQLLAGCIAFLYPGIRESLRGNYMPIHVYFGIAIFVGSISTCLIGLNEKALFSVKDYEYFVPEGILLNTIGILIGAFGSLSVYLVSQKQYKRESSPEDSVLLTDRN